MAPPPKDWSAAYRLGQTPWDLRAPTPALVALLRGSRLAEWGIPDRAEIAVPGCGRGHDVRFLARLGHAVTGFDLADEVVCEARELLRLNQCAHASILRRDVLGLLPEFAGHFDVVYEYACFCALPPHLRGAYAKQMVGALRPGGVLLMLAYPLRSDAAGTDGPPYWIQDGALDVFEQPLERVDAFAAEESPPRRAGAEHWFVWRKPGG